MVEYRRIASPFIWAGLMLAAMVSACADGSNLPPPSFASAVGEPERTARIGIGDKLKIVVFGEDNLSGTFVVDSRGNIAMPLIGTMPARGRSLDDFRKTLVARLASGYLKSPQVSVDVVTFRPIFVHGEVKSGGELEFSNGLTFRDAIAKAGGYTYRANHGYVVLSRNGAPDVRVDLPTSLTVEPGDNIRVPERFF